MRAIVASLPPCLATCLTKIQYRIAALLSTTIGNSDGDTMITVWVSSLSTYPSQQVTTNPSGREWTAVRDGEQEERSTSIYPRRDGDDDLDEKKAR